MGIIANPASGKDIRRLVAHATTVDNQGKISIVRRALIGLGTTGVRDVAIMPDTHRLGEQALQGLNYLGEAIPSTRILNMPVTGRPDDSERAAHLLRRAGAGCIIVLGGDGTVRVVSKGAGDVPLLLVSTGTNNVLPSFVEGTIAGLAAGAVATEQVDLEAVAWPHKWLELFINGASRDRALIDVVVLKGRFVGSRAVWHAENIEQVIVTRADPSDIGISAIVGVVRPISPQEPLGAALSLSVDGERRVLATVGPGLISEVGIDSMRLLQIGDVVELNADRPFSHSGARMILALDGEREIALRKGDRVSLVLRSDGPWIVDAHRVMTEMVARRLFDRHR